jgi:hypothetical protein
LSSAPISATEQADVRSRPFETRRIMSGNALDRMSVYPGTRQM